MPETAASLLLPTVTVTGMAAGALFFIVAVTVTLVSPASSATLDGLALRLIDVSSSVIVRSAGYGSESTVLGLSLLLHDLYTWG